MGKSEPLDVDTILGEFSEGDRAWMILDAVSAQRLTIPDNERFPGIEIYRFFMSDAEAVIRKVKAVPKGRLRANAVLVAVDVPLLEMARAVAAAKDRGMKVGFVVHPPSEVFDFE